MIKQIKIFFVRSKKYVGHLMAYFWLVHRFNLENIQKEDTLKMPDQNFYFSHG